MARVLENGRSFKRIVFFEPGEKRSGGLTIIVLITIIVVVVRVLFILYIVNDATVKEPVKDVNKTIIGLRLTTLFRDLSEISRGEGVETDGGSQLFETAEKGGVMKNGPLKGGGSCNMCS